MAWLLNLVKMLSNLNLETAGKTTKRPKTVAGADLEGTIWGGCSLQASAAWCNIQICSCVIAQKLHGSTALSTSNAALPTSVKLAPALRLREDQCLPPYVPFNYSPKPTTGKMLDWQPQSMKSCEQRCEARLDPINMVFVLHSALGSKLSR